MREDPFTEDNCKVSDNNHLTGAYRGAAHNMCNLLSRQYNCIPVFRHNLTNYDVHLFIKEFGKVEGDLQVIPQADDKYISFSQQVKVDEFGRMKSNRRVIFDDNNKYKNTINGYRELRFLDSFRFMASSLHKLSENLSTDQLSNMSKFYPNMDKFKLLKRKGVYSYLWMDNVSKMNHNQLPHIESFYSFIKGEDPTESEYHHAQNVWATVKCETFQDYHNICVQTGTLILADVFENFRDMCLKTYTLDPAHYGTSPGLSWSALFKHSRVKLDLIQYPDG